MVGLAGGPGQAAIPFASKLAQNIAPALATRDLLVFDQRGTGSSGELRSALARARLDRRRTCAAAIGPSRGFYRTAESVEDIEAIRAGRRLRKLVLYGISYGTKVAEAYAAKYPANVEALVLDSVVPPEGPDVFDRSTLQPRRPARCASSAARRAAAGSAATRAATSPPSCAASSAARCAARS